MQISTRQFKVAPHALMFDPEFYLFDFAIQSKATKFLLVEEAKLRAAPFVDIRFEPIAQASFSMPTNELLALETQHGEKRARSSFIFHHAFVCSTLLARCLDQIDAFFSLKEPWIIRRLADTKRDQRSRIPRAQWRQLFSTYMMLLAKHYESGKSPLIKATNVASNLLPDVLRYLPGHKALYLYSDLEGFLVSVLKKPDETRRKMPNLAKAFVRDQGFAAAFPAYCDIGSLTNLQTCALAWAACLFNFRKVVQKYGGQNVRTLDAKEFLERPEENLAALAAFFGHHCSEAEIDRMTCPDVMRTNSKNPQQEYGKDVRDRETRAILETQSRTIKEVVAWIQPIVEQQRLLEHMKTLRVA